MPKEKKYEFVQALEDISMRYYSAHPDANQLLAKSGVLPAKQIYKILKKIKGRLLFMKILWYLLPFFGPTS